MLSQKYQIVSSEPIDFSKINKDHSKLFYKALSDVANVEIFNASVKKAFSKIDFENPDCFEFLDIHSVFCTHLGLWDVLLEMLSTKVSGFLSQGNVIFILNKAINAKQDAVISVLSNKYSYHLRDREAYTLSLYQQKKAQELKYHLTPKAED